MQIEPNNKTICSHIWNGVCLRNNGRLIPCCMYDDLEPAVQIQDYNNDIEAAYNSPFFQEMRQKALRGEENKGCRGCYFREKETGRSLRLRANEFWKDTFNGPQSPLSQVNHLEIFVGNLCNLKCLMCSPDLSSYLAADHVKLGWVDASLQKTVENDYRAILPKFTQLTRLKIVGGEPLLSQLHWQLLDSIPLEKAQNITLEYATNCTVFPNEKELQIWKKFKALEIILSIDGVGSVNEYIRYPSRWNVIAKNAIQFRELTQENPRHVFGINTVVSNFNIFELDHLTNWVQQNLGILQDRFGSTTFFYSCLVYPDYLNIKNLPIELKKNLLEKYPDTPHYSFVRAVLKSEGDTSKLGEYKYKVASFDKVRKIDYRNFIPSMQLITDVLP